MANYVIATTKSWNIENSKLLEQRFPDDKFYIITTKDNLNVEVLDEIQPRYIFFPHWSWIIPEKIFNSYECVVFHMADLPFGRGGSPLQNLIVRGIYKTKISALKVEAGLDAGPIYMKCGLDISKGNANEILQNVSDIVFKDMIPRIIEEQMIPVPQEGVPVLFKRRVPEQSEIPEGLSSRQLYDYIRMLDGEGYPAAYKDVDNLRMYFTNAKIDGETICAEVHFECLDKK